MANIKKQILNINDYKAYAYTNEYKELANQIKASAGKYFDTKDANNFIITSDFLTAFKPVAFNCFKDETYQNYCNLSNTKQKQVLASALKYAFKSDIFVDLSTIRTATKNYNYETRFNLNLFIYQVALFVATDGGAKTLSIQNPNFTPKAPTIKSKNIKR